MPGTLLGRRYRIVGLLGRGGMGEVYRAEDLKLGQPVALKFLPEGLERDDTRLTRFLNEVKLARQVSHSNVCRVYDVGEVDGQHYLSMEYVDGEDLASLLRRIGRLPKDKAVQVARQICAGLAAAHELGILHRDLKPANVMLDGRGRVKIADFGLAGLEEAIQAGEVRSGTPAYMAPEQLAGREVTVRSDLYALGLVLYELFTGKPAFEAATPAELVRLREESTPTGPSSHVPDLDASVEAAILHCLEAEPRDRPSSALAVAAALPGGSALEAVLVSGETPSPELLADAGGQGALRPGVAVACLLVALAGVGGIAFLLGEEALPVGKPPPVLAEDARRIARSLGYPDSPAHTAHGLFGNTEYLEHIAESDDSPDRWQRLGDARPTAVRFWHRQSPRPLVPDAWIRVTSRDPPVRVSGMVNLWLDSRGRLDKLVAVPPAVDEANGASPAPDWTALFAAAQLDPDRLHPVESTWTSEVFCDTRAAWTGTYPQQPDPEIRVEACAYRGRPVYFEIIHPWEQARRMQEWVPTTGERIGALLWAVAVPLVLIVGAFLLVRRNLRAGRGDRRGALRVTLFVAGLQTVRYLLVGSHVASVPDELSLLTKGLGQALLYGLLCWMLYIGLEPVARRLWPGSMVSWSRLIGGRFRDPLVGAHVLIGAAWGAAATLLVLALKMAPGWLGLPPIQPDLPLHDAFLPSRWFGAAALWTVFVAFTTTLATTIFLLVVRVILRRGWLAAGAYVSLYALASGLGEDLFLFWSAIGLVGMAAFVFVLIRYGLVAAVAFSLIETLGRAYLPLTLDFSQWYAGGSLFVLLAVAALVGCAFYTSLGGRIVLSDRLLALETPRRG